MSADVKSGLRCNILALPICRSKKLKANVLIGKNNDTRSI